MLANIENLSQKVTFPEKSNNSPIEFLDNKNENKNSDNISFKDSLSESNFSDFLKSIQSKYDDKLQKPKEIKKALGKDDFLKIMVTQMKNQDPTNPFKADQMATQLAQFTTVEQLQNVNNNLGKIALQNKPVENLAMTHLIGKYVTVNRHQFMHAEGQSSDIKFRLSNDASHVHLSIVNDSGKMIFEKDLGSEKAGDVSFSWDGLEANLSHAKTGSYQFKVSAKDDQGRVIESTPEVIARVMGVSYQGNEPVFLIGDSKNEEKVLLKDIIRVEIENTDKLKNLAYLQKNILKK